MADADLDPRWEGASARSRSEAAEALPGLDPATALGSFVCALREAFEEVGFPVGTGPMSKLERATGDDPEGFLHACATLGITLATDRLLPIARWVTPVGSPIRFDTRFFVARAPAQWRPVADHGEVEDCRWSTPAAALRSLGSGESIMAPPTIDVLQRLTRFGAAVEILDAGRVGTLAGGRRILAARLSPLVRVVVAPNPGLMTGPGTNTYIVGKDRTFVIDPAVPDLAYLDAVAAAAGDVAAILVTHRHPDHEAGVTGMVARTEAPVMAFGEEPVGETQASALGDGRTLKVPGVTLRTIHAPGHAADHVCFLLAQEEALFAGDVILGEGTPVIAPPDGDMRAYLETLRRLSDLPVRRIYPGHFRLLDDASSTFARYIRHRSERAGHILAALQSGPVTVEHIVARVYADTPAELHALAARSTLAHLNMLEEDGRVRRRGGLWSAEAQ